MKYKNLLAMLLSFALVFSFAACTENDIGNESNTISNEDKASEMESDSETVVQNTDITVNVAVLKGPTGMGMSKLIKDSNDGNTSYKYDVSIYSSTDEITAEVIKGTYDIAAVPSNLASVLYNKTEGGIKVTAIHTLGVLYFLENGDTIHSVEDLRGKTIYLTGQGATPEYIVNYILQKNGIDPEKDVEIIFLQEHSELATLLATGDVLMGVLPEPNVTVAMSRNENLRIALNLTEEWDKVAEDTSVLIQGVLIVNSEFAEAHPDVLDAFLDEYKESVNYVNENKDEASLLIESYGIVPKADLAKKAIPNCNICFYTAKEYKNELLGFLTALYEQNTKSVGGKLPDSGFFYEK